MTWGYSDRGVRAYGPEGECRHALTNAKPKLRSYLRLSQESDDHPGKAMLLYTAQRRLDLAEQVEKDDQTLSRG
jgi:hypothetical protein